MHAHGPGSILEALHAAGRGLPLWPACQCAAVLAASGWFLVRSRGAARALRPLLAVSFAGAAVGAALLSVLLRLPGWLRSDRPLSELMGGVVAYGALGGLVLSFAALVRWRRLPVLPALDRLAPCLGALVLLGRAGCFFAGCDFGAISGAPWAIRFPSAAPAFQDHLARGLILATDRRSLPVHPTQVYEAILGILMAAAALAVERRGARRGAPFWTAAAVYAAGRLALDPLRGDTAAAAWGPWAPSRWMSAALLAAALIWMASPRHASSSPTGVSETGAAGGNHL